MYLNEELSKKIISYLNEKMLKKKKILENEKSTSDFEYFFLLLTSLSYRQIEILNETQLVNVQDAKYRNLPILFSKQFKNSLNPTQKRMFNKLRVLSLIRDKILKDPNLPISVDNFNINILNINLNFDDLKIKNKNVPDIIDAMNKTEQKQKQKIYFKKFNKKPSIKNEELFSMFTGKETKKDIMINFIFHKIKASENESISEEKNDGQNNNGDGDLKFRYQNNYDINIIRNELIKKINNNKTLSVKTKILYIEIVKSNAFIHLMNSFDLGTIKDMADDLEILIYFLKLVKDMSMKEFKLYKKLKGETVQINSSRSSFSIDVFQKNNINNLKRSLNSRISYKNFSMEKLNLNRKRFSLNFYGKNED